jgi:hypothetical protein
MATAFEKPVSARSEEKFFFRMACLMAAVIVAGFAMNLAMGRSTFAVPIVYHVHAFVFFTWVAIYLAQNWLVTSGNLALHRSLGRIAAIWVPLMLVLAFAIMFTSLRRAGGPFFFDQNEFMVANTLGLFTFGGLVAAAVVQRRRTDWHRRLMFSAMTILTGPGLGRLLPMPLMIPNAWRIMMGVTLIFPVTGMIADVRRSGKVHPAWYWGIAAIVVMQLVAELIAYSSLGVSLTHWVVDGTPGAARPMHAFLPPGFGA